MAPSSEMFPYIMFSPELMVPTYFLVISITYMVCSYWLFHRAQRFHLSQKFVLDVCLIIMVSGFVGARFFHVVYEHPDYYVKVPSQAFKFWQGGFVFYGGLFTSLIAVLFYLKKKKQDIGLWMDLFAPVIVFGYFMGRFATLLSGSGYGRPTDVPWAITYPPGPEAPAGIPLHPTPIYSMIWSLIALLFIWLGQKKSFSFFNFKGSYLLAYGVYHGLGRLWIEQFRDDYRGDSILFLSVSSWLSLILISFSVFYFVKIKKTMTMHP